MVGFRTCKFLTPPRGPGGDASRTGQVEEVNKEKDNRRRCRRRRNSMMEEKEEDREDGDKEVEVKERR